VGHGQTRKGCVVLTTLGFSRAISAGLVFSKEAPDLLWAISRGIWRLGGLPELLVSDREGALHAGGGRPTEAYARLLGELAVGHLILEPRDAPAKGLIENRGRYLRSNFEPGRSFASELDCQDQLDRWCAEVNARTHRTPPQPPTRTLLLTDIEASWRSPSRSGAASKAGASSFAPPPSGWRCSARQSAKARSRTSCARSSACR
jgi:hypothetical protein